MTTLDQKIKEYLDTFGENVPVFCMPPMTDDELAAVINESLRTGEPIRPDIPDDPSIIF